MLFDPLTTPIARRLNFTTATTSRRTENRLDGAEMREITNDLGYICIDSQRKSAMQYLADMKSSGIEVPMQRPVLSDDTLHSLMSALTELLPPYKYYPEYEHAISPYHKEEYYTVIAECIKGCLCADEFEFINKLCMARHNIHKLAPLTLVDLLHCRWLLKEGLLPPSRGGWYSSDNIQIRSSVTSVLATFNYMRVLFNLGDDMKKLKALTLADTHMYAGDNTLTEIGAFMQNTRQKSTIAMGLAVLTAPIFSEAMELHKAVALHMYLGENFSMQSPLHFKESITRSPLKAVLGDLSLSMGNLHITHDLTIPMSLLVTSTAALTKSARDANDAEHGTPPYTPRYKMFERMTKNTVQPTRKIPFELTTTPFNHEKDGLFSKYDKLPPEHICVMVVSDPICKYVVPFFMGVGIDTSVVAFTPATQRALAVISTLYSRFGTLPLRDPLAAHHLDSETLSNPENSGFPETFCAAMELLNSVSNSKLFYVDKKANAYVHLPNMYLGLTDINSALFGVPSPETQSDHNMWHTFTIRPKRNIDYSGMLKLHRTYYF